MSGRSYQDMRRLLELSLPILQLPAMRGCVEQLKVAFSSMSTLASLEDEKDFARMRQVLPGKYGTLYHPKNKAA